MDLYSTKLSSIPSDDFNISLMAGSVILRLRFHWDNDTQEQYDIAVRALNSLRNSDPLIAKDGSIIRDYDYIGYYTAITYKIPTELPQSLRSLDDTNLLNVLLERKEQAIELGSVIQAYEEHLVWQCDITDPDETVYSADVVPGGWVNNQSSTWRLQFVSNLEVVGKDNLIDVEIRVEA